MRIVKRLYQRPIFQLNDSTSSFETKKTWNTLQITHFLLIKQKLTNASDGNLIPVALKSIFALQTFAK